MFVRGAEAVRVVVATAEGGGPYDGVFWSTYLAAGGPRPEGVLFLANENERGALRKAAESMLLFRPSEAARLISAKKLGRPLRAADRERGLHRGFSDLFSPEIIRRVDSLNSDRGRSVLRELEADVLVSVGSPEIFGDRVLEIPRRTCLNVHNGRLPGYRGMFGTFWELYFGERRGWVTVHEMIPEVDAGDIVAERTVELGASLFEALVAKKEIGGRLLADLLTGETETRRTPQCGRESESGYYSWPSLGQMWRLRFGG